MPDCSGFADCPCDDIDCVYHGSGSRLLTEDERQHVLRFVGPYCQPVGKLKPWKRAWLGEMILDQGRLPL
jgi:hypothetical protein